MSELKYKLKYPITSSTTPSTIPSKPNVQQSLLLGISNKREFIEPVYSSSSVFLLLIYFLTFFYFYYSSKKHLSKKEFTLSRALQYSEKKFSTLLLIGLVCALFSTYIDKGLITNTSSIEKKSLIYVLFTILGLFLLLFLIPPTDKEIRKHAIVVFFLLCFIIFSSFVYSYLYDSVYEEEHLIIGINYLTYFLLILFGIISLFFILLIGFGINTSVYIGITEVFIILSYGIIIGILGQLPVLVDLKLNCSAQIL